MRIRKNSNQGGVERDLRDARPHLPGDLARSLSAAAGTPRRGSGRRTVAARLAVLGIAVAAMAALGGIGFAASTAITSSKVKVQTVAAGSAKSVAVRNAAADQYAAEGSKAPVGAREFVAPAKEKPAVDTAPGYIFISTQCTVAYQGKLQLWVYVDGNRKVYAKIDPSRTTVDGDPLTGNIGNSASYTIAKPRTVQIVFAVVVANVAGTKRSAKETLTPVCYMSGDRAEAPAVTVTKVPAALPVKKPQAANVTKTLKLSTTGVKKVVKDALQTRTATIVVTPRPGVTITWNGATSTTSITMKNAGLIGKIPNWDVDVTYSLPPTLKISGKAVTYTFSAS